MARNERRLLSLAQEKTATAGSSRGQSGSPQIKAHISRCDSQRIFLSPPIIGPAEEQALGILQEDRQPHPAEEQAGVGVVCH